MRTTLKKITAAAAVAIGALLVLPAGPALAIGQVSCADNKVTPAKLNIKTSASTYTSRCFSGAGVTAVSIANVQRVEAGGNTLTVNYELAGLYHTKTFTPGTHINFGSVVRVYELRIW
ncbi:hypothetical protein KCV87_16875 [Actinosynnema pretiosum subsp. pretiosum]|uniref:Streptomyces killer toxin-like beta/gamma crystallin domain-containing protein n=1 Tax=Actinosynnema pretiosum subsp. pretiosum TaxID=103721 RepID=A0AA45LCJ0_9PSEU|nr:hypothetical protein APASM_0697 [Actinosynnema pretiosum subsp. pretiosum]QUF07537.1 hypothetical protein KCV87_16875 [Actinosynnema pretiosum subsp. pretiosum]